MDNKNTDFLERLRNADTREAAFTQLIRNHQEKLYWQIRRMVSTHADADDILQNTFVKAWQAIENFRGESSIDTWLYTIASRETINHLRSQKPNISLDADFGSDDDATLPPIQLESDTYFDGNETQRHLQEAISTLPPRQREVFTLKYFQEMKYQDMSQMLNTSIGALKASYHHAVEKITRYFEALD